MSGNGLEISYSYNNAGQILSTHYFKNDNQTNGNGEGAGYQNTYYGYDAYGRNTIIHAGTESLAGAEANKRLVRGYTYNAIGDLVQTKDYPDFKNDGSSYTLTNYAYDSIGRMQSKTYEDHRNGSSTGVVKEAHSLTYDKNGNILSESIRNNYDTDTTVSKGYVYDSVGRLVTATEDSKTTTYTYDNVGNRTGMTEGGKSFSYAYNSLDQLTSISEGGSVKSSYTYDSRGNQTKEVSEHFKVTINGTERIDNKVTDHTYDLMNQLTSSTVTTPVVDQQLGTRLADEVNTSQNSYDAAGKRIKRVETINGVEETSRFYYMGTAVLYTSSEQNVLQTENILDLAGTTIMSFRFLWPYQAQNTDYANQWFTYRYDVRGSVTNITNPEGNQVKGYKYNEFGQTQEAGSANFKNELTFTGSVKDTSTGLQYMNARFYEPQTGRFLSQDSYTGNAYDPWTQHLYAYCANNPVNFVDPTGHAATPWESIGLSEKEYKDIQFEARGYQYSVVESLSNPYMFSTKVRTIIAKANKYINRNKGEAPIRKDGISNLKRGEICLDGVKRSTLNDLKIEYDDSDPEDGGQNWKTGHTIFNSYVNPLEVNFIVKPGGNQSSYEYNDLGMVIDMRTGKFVWAVVAETGPRHKFFKNDGAVSEEASYATWQSLGHTYVHGNQSARYKKGQKYGDFRIVVFDYKINFVEGAGSIQEQINKAGAAFAQKYDISPYLQP